MVQHVVNHFHCMKRESGAMIPASYLFYRNFNCLWGIGRLSRSGCLLWVLASICQSLNIDTYLRSLSMSRLFKTQMYRWNPYQKYLSPHIAFHNLLFQDSVWLSGPMFSYHCHRPNHFFSSRSDKFECKYFVSWIRKVFTDSTKYPITIWEQSHVARCRLSPPAGSRSFDFSFWTELDFSYNWNRITGIISGNCTTKYLVYMALIS